MRLIARILALFLTPSLFAQTPAGTIPISSEISTIVSVSTNASYKFGANGHYNAVTNPSYPVKIDCSGVGCPWLGGDPLPGVVKTIYAVQQKSAYTVTWKNASGVLQPPVTVPALPIIYTLHCDGTGQIDSPGNFTSSNLVCKGVKQ